MAGSLRDRVNAYNKEKEKKEEEEFNQSFHDAVTSGETKTILDRHGDDSALGVDAEGKTTIVDPSKTKEVTRVIDYGALRDLGIDETTIRHLSVKATQQLAHQKNLERQQEEEQKRLQQEADRISALLIDQGQMEIDSRDRDKEYEWEYGIGNKRLHREYGSYDNYLVGQYDDDYVARRVNQINYILDNPDLQRQKFDYQQYNSLWYSGQRDQAAAYYDATVGHQSADPSYLKKVKDDLINNSAAAAAVRANPSSGVTQEDLGLYFKHYYDSAEDRSSAIDSIQRKLDLYEKVSPYTAYQGGLDKAKDQDELERELNFLKSENSPIDTSIKRYQAEKGAKDSVSSANKVVEAAQNAIMQYVASGANDVNELNRLTDAYNEAKRQAEVAVSDFISNYNVTEYAKNNNMTYGQVLAAADGWDAKADAIAQTEINGVPGIYTAEYAQAKKNAQILRDFSLQRTSEEQLRKWQAEDQGVLDMGNYDAQLYQAYLYGGLDKEAEDYKTKTSFEYQNQARTRSAAVSNELVRRSSEKFSESMIEYEQLPWDEKNDESNKLTSAHKAYEEFVKALSGDYVLDEAGNAQLSTSTYQKDFEKSLKTLGYSDKDIANIVQYTKREINEIDANGMKDVLRKEVSKGNVAAALWTGVSVVTNLFSGLGMMEGLMKLGDKSDYQGIDPNSRWLTAQIITNTIRETVQDNIDWNYNGLTGKNIDFFDKFYGVVTSSLDSVAAAYVGSALVGGASMGLFTEAGPLNFLGQLGSTLEGTGTAIGKLAGDFVGGMAGGTIIGLSAATESLVDISERGGTVQEAFTGALMSGLFESLFETVSISQFQALQETAKMTTFKEIVSNLGKSMLTNFTEEFATEVAGVVYDRFVNGDISNYAANIEKYRQEYLDCIADPHIDPKEADEQAMHYAKKQAAKDAALQCLEAGASGAIQGVLMGATSTLSHAARVQLNIQKISELSIANPKEMDTLELSKHLRSVESTYSSLASLLTEQMQENALTKKQMLAFKAIDSAFYEAVSELADRNVTSMIGGSIRNADGAVQVGQLIFKDNKGAELYTQLYSGDTKNGKPSGIGYSWDEYGNVSFGTWENGDFKTGLRFYVDGSYRIVSEQNGKSVPGESNRLNMNSATTLEELNIDAKQFGNLFEAPDGVVNVALLYGYIRDNVEAADITYKASQRMSSLNRSLSEVEDKLSKTRTNSRQSDSLMKERQSIQQELERLGKLFPEAKKLSGIKTKPTQTAKATQQTSETKTAQKPTQKIATANNVAQNLQQPGTTQQANEQAVTKDLSKAGLNASGEYERTTLIRQVIDGVYTLAEAKQVAEQYGDDVNRVEKNIRNLANKRGVALTEASSQTVQSNQNEQAQNEQAANDDGYMDALLGSEPPAAESNAQTAAEPVSEAEETAQQKYDRLVDERQGIVNKLNQRRSKLTADERSALQERSVELAEEINNLKSELTAEKENDDERQGFLKAIFKRNDSRGDHEEAVERAAQDKSARRAGRDDSAAVDRDFGRTYDESEINDHENVLTFQKQWVERYRNIGIDISDSEFLKPNNTYVNALRNIGVPIIVISDSLSKNLGIDAETVWHKGELPGILLSDSALRANDWMETVDHELSHYAMFTDDDLTDYIADHLDGIFDRDYQFEHAIDFVDQNGTVSANNVDELINAIARHCDIDMSQRQYDDLDVLEKAQIVSEALCIISSKKDSASPEFKKAFLDYDDILLQLKEADKRIYGSFPSSAALETTALNKSLERRYGNRENQSSDFSSGFSKVVQQNYDAALNLLQQTQNGSATVRDISPALRSLGFAIDANGNLVMDSALFRFVDGGETAFDKAYADFQNSVSKIVKDGLTINYKEIENAMRRRGFGNQTAGVIGSVRNPGLPPYSVLSAPNYYFEVGKANGKYSVTPYTDPFSHKVAETFAQMRANENARVLYDFFALENGESAYSTRRAELRSAAKNIVYQDALESMASAIADNTPLLIYDPDDAYTGTYIGESIKRIFLKDRNGNTINEKVSLQDVIIAQLNERLNGYNSEAAIAGEFESDNDLSAAEDALAQHDNVVVISEDDLPGLETEIDEDGNETVVVTQELIDVLIGGIKKAETNKPIENSDDYSADYREVQNKNGSHETRSWGDPTYAAALKALLGVNDSELDEIVYGRDSDINYEDIHGDTASFSIAGKTAGGGIMLRYNASDDSLKLRPVNADEVQRFFCDPDLQQVSDLNSIFWTKEGYGKKIATTRSQLKNFETDIKARILTELMQEMLQAEPVTITIAPGSNTTPSGTPTQTLSFLSEQIKQHKQNVGKELDFYNDFADQEIVPKPVFDALKEIEVSADYDKKLHSDLQIQAFDESDNLNADVFTALGAKNGQRALEAYKAYQDAFEKYRNDSAEFGKNKGIDKETIDQQRKVLWEDYRAVMDAGDILRDEIGRTNLYYYSQEERDALMGKTIIEIEDNLTGERKRVPLEEALNDQIDTLERQQKKLADQKRELDEINDDLEDIYEIASINDLYDDGVGDNDIASDKADLVRRKLQKELEIQRTEKGIEGSKRRFEVLKRGIDVATEAIVKVKNAEANSMLAADQDNKRTVVDSNGVVYFYTPKNIAADSRYDLRMKGQKSVIMNSYEYAHDLYASDPFFLYQGETEFWDSKTVKEIYKAAEEELRSQRPAFSESAYTEKQFRGQEIIDRDSYGNPIIENAQTTDYDEYLKSFRQEARNLTVERVRNLVEKSSDSELRKMAQDGDDIQELLWWHDRYETAFTYAALAWWDKYSKNESKISEEAANELRRMKYSDEDLAQMLVQTGAIKAPSDITISELNKLRRYIKENYNMIFRQAEDIWEDIEYAQKRTNIRNILASESVYDSIPGLDQFDVILGTPKNTLFADDFEIKAETDKDGNKIRQIILNKDLNWNERNSALMLSVSLLGAFQNENGEFEIPRDPIRGLNANRVSTFESETNLDDPNSALSVLTKLLKNGFEKFDALTKSNKSYEKLAKKYKRDFEGLRRATENGSAFRYLQSETGEFKSLIFNIADNGKPIFNESEGINRKLYGTYRQLYELSGSSDNGIVSESRDAQRRKAAKTFAQRGFKVAGSVDAAKAQILDHLTDYLTSDTVVNKVNPYGATLKDVLDAIDGQTEGNLMSQEVFDKLRSGEAIPGLSLFAVDYSGEEYKDKLKQALKLKGERTFALSDAEVERFREYLNNPKELERRLLDYLREKFNKATANGKYVVQSSDSVGLSNAYSYALAQLRGEMEAPNPRVEKALEGNADRQFAEAILLTMKFNDKDSALYKSFVEKGDYKGLANYFRQEYETYDAYQEAYYEYGNKSRYETAGRRIDAAINMIRSVTGSDYSREQLMADLAPYLNKSGRVTESKKPNIKASQSTESNNTQAVPKAKSTDEVYDVTQHVTTARVMNRATEGEFSASVGEMLGRYNELQKRLFDEVHDSIGAKSSEAFYETTDSFSQQRTMQLQAIMSTYRNFLNDYVQKSGADYDADLYDYMHGLYQNNLMFGDGGILSIFRGNDFASDIDQRIYNAALQMGYANWMTDAVDQYDYYDLRNRFYVEIYRLAGQDSKNGFGTQGWYETIAKTAHDTMEEYFGDADVFINAIKRNPEALSQMPEHIQRAFMAYIYSTSDIKPNVMIGANGEESYPGLKFAVAQICAENPSAPFRMIEQANEETILGVLSAVSFADELDSVAAKNLNKFWDAVLSSDDATAALVVNALNDFMNRNEIYSLADINKVQLSNGNHLDADSALQFYFGKRGNSIRQSYGFSAIVIHPSLVMNVNRLMNKHEATLMAKDMGYFGTLAFGNEAEQTKAEDGFFHTLNEKTDAYLLNLWRQNSEETLSKEQLPSQIMQRCAEFADVPDIKLAVCSVLNDMLEDVKNEMKAKHRKYADFQQTMQVVNIYNAAVSFANACTNLDLLSGSSGNPGYLDVAEKMRDWLSVNVQNSFISAQILENSSHSNPDYQAILLKNKIRAFTWANEHESKNGIKSLPPLLGLTDEDFVDYRNALASGDAEEIDKQYDYMMRTAGKTLKSNYTLFKRFNQTRVAWRYGAMLSQPTTQANNMVSTMAHAAAMDAADLIQWRKEQAAIRKGTLDQSAATVAPVNKRTDSALFELGAENYELAINQIYSKSRLGSMLKDVYERAGSTLAHINILTQALEAEDHLMGKALYKQKFASVLKARGITADAYDQLSTTEKAEIQSIAVERTQEVLFRGVNILTDTLGKWNSTKLGHLLMTPVMPFVNIGGNLVTAAVNFSPAGFVINAFAKWMTNVSENIMHDENGAIISKSKWQESFYKTAEWMASQNTDTKRMHRASMAWVGTGGLLLGFIGRLFGFITAGEDKDDDIAALERLEGFKAYSLHVGNTYISLKRLFPACMSFLAGAKIADIIIKGKYQFGDLFTEVFADNTFFGDWLSSWNRNMEAFGAMANKKYDNELIEGLNYFTAIGATAAQSYATQYIPGLSKTIENIFFEENKDTFFYDKESALPYGLQYVLSEAAEAIPKLDYNRVERRDILGRKTAHETFGQYLLRVAIGDYSKAEYTAPQWLHELAEKDDPDNPGHKLSEKVIFPTIQKSTRVSGKRLTDEEFDVYSDVLEAELSGVYDALTGNEAFQSADDSAKAKIIDMMYDSAAAKARAKIIEMRGDKTNEPYYGNSYIGDGNIDLHNLKPIADDEGNWMTTYTYTIKDGDKWVNIPGVVDIDGKRVAVNEEQAERIYREAGKDAKYFGKFDSLERAEIAANALHLEQEAYYDLTKSEMSALIDNPKDYAEFAMLDYATKFLNSDNYEADFDVLEPLLDNWNAYSPLVQNTALRISGFEDLLNAYNASKDEKSGFEMEDYNKLDEMYSSANSKKLPADLDNLADTIQSTDKNVLDYYVKEKGRPFEKVREAVEKGYDLTQYFDLVEAQKDLFDDGATANEIKQYDQLRNNANKNALGLVDLVTVHNDNLKLQQANKDGYSTSTFFAVRDKFKELNDKDIEKKEKHDQLVTWLHQQFSNDKDADYFDEMFKYFYNMPVSDTVKDKFYDYGFTDASAQFVAHMFENLTVQDGYSDIRKCQKIIALDDAYRNGEFADLRWSKEQWQAFLLSYAGTNKNYSTYDGCISYYQKEMGKKKK